MKLKRWLFEAAPHPSDIESLSKSLNISRLPATLLWQRGIREYETARQFFRPSLSQLHDPFLMKGMDIAIERIQKALHNQETILIYGDYDVDGTTSVALVYGFLKKIYPHLLAYIPDRHKEGYGITYEGLNFAIEKKVGLIISLDCGVKANEQIDYAKKNGIDFIICDHHLPDGELPAALAMLNPKQIDCPYPFKELTGCGIGFKLLSAFCQRTQTPERLLHQYLDLVVLSIAADLVPLVGENRVLAFFGLEKLNIDPLAGLKALLRLTNGYGRKITIKDLVFSISPRINAAGRLADAYDSLNLLLSENDEEASRLAKLVNEKNDTRRDIEKGVIEEAFAMLDAQSESRRANVIFKKDWNKGVVGIVAARCVDKYYRPTIVLTESEDLVVGSARSIQEFDLYQTLEHCSDLLLQFGGHKYAAGLSLRRQDLPEFQARFENLVAQRLEPNQLVPPVRIDMEIGFEEISTKMFAVVQQMSPFGPQNMRPVFLARKIKVENIKIIKNRHLKFTAKQQHLSFGAIVFNDLNFLEILEQQEWIDLVFLVVENEYAGNKVLQLEVRDLRPFVE
ncbi:single-stranded-DNA-specific exonuclease RecJ [Hugenholtzia roseola]|uniref:single-stranded-DNA-specific exonuclease RecJ n=1 Tax=Hugenholtzia roseola TaxID=1002 RepID=UPI00040C7C00|nr:single-stranded-DNA-specific exonuclease RecJ [Hugenholtzia roseola]